MFVCLLLALATWHWKHETNKRLLINLFLPPGGRYAQRLRRQVLRPPQSPSLPRVHLEVGVEIASPVSSDINMIRPILIRHKYDLSYLWLIPCYSPLK